MVGASDKDNKLARVFSNYGPRTYKFETQMSAVQLFAALLNRSKWQQLILKVLGIDVYAPGTETPVLATSMGLGSDVQAGTSFGKWMGFSCTQC